AGSNGTSAVNLATNCYQWLMQAQNAGYIWNKVADRSRFESLTGCRVRDININPYAQVPNSIAGWTANVLTSKFVARTMGGGEGDIDSSGPASFGALGYYEITAEKPAGHIFCSPNGNTGYQRVLVSPVNGKLYAQASLWGNHLRNRTDIAIGSGTPTQTEVIGSTRNLSSESGTIQVRIEDMPEALALGHETILRILSVKIGQTFIDPTHFSISTSNDKLMKLETMPDEAGYVAVLKITTNQVEAGNGHLKFSVYTDQTHGNDWDVFNHDLPVGVTNCPSGATSPFQEITEWTNVYRIYEDRVLPAPEDNFASTIGWINEGWFPEPQI
ncbi:MAG: hypothetical protein RLZZ56_655, partial [Actinomycetota bacterium]